MSEKFKVKLIGPAKVEGEWFWPGDEPEVSAKQIPDLIAAGALPPADTVVTAPEPAPETRALMTVAEWEAAVAAEAKKLAAAAFDGELAKIEAELKDIVAQSEQQERDKAAAIQQRDEALGRVSDLEAQVASLTVQIATIENAAHTAAAGDTPPQEDTPPSEKAAKTAPRKGAAATTKG